MNWLYKLHPDDISLTKPYIIFAIIICGIFLAEALSEAIWNTTYKNKTFQLYHKTISKFFQGGWYALIFTMGWASHQYGWHTGSFIAIAVFERILYFNPLYNLIGKLKWNYLGSTSFIDRIIFAIFGGNIWYDILAKIVSTILLYFTIFKPSII